MATLNINLDDRIEKQAEELFSKIGISIPTAINLFIHQAILRNGLPFDVCLEPFYHPNNNKHLQQTFDDYEKKINFSEHEFNKPKIFQPQKFAGKIKWNEDPVDYQKKIRDEWN